MNDPRENCPWKCKHCLCYEGEIKRLHAENKTIRETAVKYMTAYEKIAKDMPHFIREEFNHQLERVLGKHE